MIHFFEIMRKQFEKNSKFIKENNWYRLKGKCFSCNNGADGDIWVHRKKD